MKVIADLLRTQADLITGLPVEYKITAEDTSMLPEDVIMEKISIYPQKVGTAQRIIALCASMSESELGDITVDEERDFSQGAMGIMEKYSDTILEIICIGIHNKRGKYPEWMKEFLKANFTWEELHVFLNAILFRIGTLSFIRSTTDIKKAGLLNRMEIIAMQQNLMSWEKN